MSAVLLSRFVHHLSFRARSSFVRDLRVEPGRYAHFAPSGQSARTRLSILQGKFSRRAASAKHHLWAMRQVLAPQA